MLQLMEYPFKVSVKVEPPDADAPGYDIYKDITDEQRETARKNNECFLCKKRFSRFSTFKRHMKRHTVTHTSLNAK